MTQCTTKLPCGLHPRLPLQVSFDAPDISSDGGLLLLRQAEERLGICRELASLIPDTRDRRRIRHSLDRLLMQRIFQIAMGYEDCNDADTLRHDRMFKTVCGAKDIDHDARGSQPTLRRLENSVDSQTVERAYEKIEDLYVRTLAEDTETVILDIDATDDPTYGKQQLTMFHGYYDTYMYHPLLVFDGHSGALASVLLRPGNKHASSGALGILRRLIGKIKARFPEAMILVRGDSGYCVPHLLRGLEELNARYGGVEYLLGIARNKVLERKLEPSLEQVRRQYREDRRRCRIFSWMDYAAGSWERTRSVIGKAEMLDKGENPRFIITSLTGFPAELIYHHYCQRGNCENRIKDFKNALQAGRLSCSRFLSNCFRLILHAAAYWLMHAIRQQLQETAPELARHQFDTLRLKLLKIAAKVTQSCRRIRIQLPASFPLKRIFLQMLSDFRPPGQLAPV